MYFIASSFWGMVAYQTNGGRLDRQAREETSRGDPGEPPRAGALAAVANCAGMSEQLHGAFGQDDFGRRAEAAARFLGTPRYIAAQTLVVILWIAVNAAAVTLRWDPYPFILLNLAFSTQAAYAAPLILLAQTRQADRDKLAVQALEAHREEVSRQMEEREAALKEQTGELKDLLAANTALTRQDKELTERVAALTQEIHAHLTAGA
jgi:uncharacterized membrane protein